jgi:Flp pilus assembly protein TadD
MQRGRTRRRLTTLTSLVFVLAPVCKGRTPEALTKVDVVGLLAGGAPADDVAAWVQRNGIAFRPTPEFLQLIQRTEVSVDPGNEHLAHALASARMSQTNVETPSESEILQDLVRGAEKVVKDYPPTSKGWAAAEQEFREALQLDPTNPALHFALASALAGQGKCSLAIPDARDALNAMPDLAVAHIVLGQALAGSGDPSAGMAELRTAVQVDPHSDFSRGTLARARLGTGDFNGAVEVLREGINAQPDDAVLHNSLGTVLFEHGDVTGAISEFRRALALGSADPQLRVDLAIALEREGDRNGAIGQLQAAIKLDPNFFRPHYLLAEVLIDEHQLQGAMTELNEVIRLRPDYAPAYSERGYVLVEQHHVDEAIQQYHEAIRLDPKFASAHANLGAAYWRKHDNEDGYKEILIAHELAPNDPTITMQFDKLPEKWKQKATQPAEILRPANAPMGEPPKPDFVYYVDEQTNSLVPLEAETPTFGGKTGAFGTTVYSSVIGERSPVSLRAGSKWDFLIRPAGPAQKLNFRLERFESKGGSRTVSLGTKVHITSNPKKSGLLSFNSTPYGNSSIELTIPYDLVPGEYGFFVSASTGGFAMFCFGVEGP